MKIQNFASSKYNLVQSGLGRARGSAGEGLAPSAQAWAAAVGRKLVPAPEVVKSCGGFSLVDLKWIEKWISRNLQGWKKPSWQKMAGFFVPKIVYSKDRFWCWVFSIKVLLTVKQWRFDRLNYPLKYILIAFSFLSKALKC